MSIDGPGLLENDLAHDAYRRILDLWDAGASLEQIRQQLQPLEDFAAEPIDEDSLLAACIKAFREIGQPVQARRERLCAVIDEGASLAAWAEAGAALARRRRAVLERLLEQSAVPNPRPRPRRSHAPVRDKLFDVGDCLEFVGASRTWYALVCSVRDQRGRCGYHIAPMRSVRRPTRRAFEDGKVFAHWLGSPGEDIVGVHPICVDHRALRREGNPFRTVARIDLDPALLRVARYGADTAVADIEAGFERIEQHDAGPMSLQRWPIPVVHMLREDR